MRADEQFFDYYADLLEGRYDCVDRLVVNANFAMGQTGGGTPAQVDLTKAQQPVQTGGTHPGKDLLEQVGALSIHVPEGAGEEDTDFATGNRLGGGGWQVRAPCRYQRARPLTYQILLRRKVKNTNRKNDGS